MDLGILKGEMSPISSEASRGTGGVWTVSNGSPAGDSSNPLPALGGGSRSQLTLNGDPENVLLGWEAESTG